MAERHSHPGSGPAGPRLWGEMAERQASADITLAVCGSATLADGESGHEDGSDDGIVGAEPAAGSAATTDTESS